MRAKYARILFFTCLSLSVVLFLPIANAGAKVQYRGEIGGETVGPKFDSHQLKVGINIIDEEAGSTAKSFVEPRDIRNYHVRVTITNLSDTPIKFTWAHGGLRRPICYDNIDFPNVKIAGIDLAPRASHQLIGASFDYSWACQDEHDGVPPVTFDVTIWSQSLKPAEDKEWQCTIPGFGCDGQTKQPAEKKSKKQNTTEKNNRQRECLVLRVIDHH